MLGFIVLGVFWLGMLVWRGTFKPSRDSKAKAAATPTELTT